MCGSLACRSADCRDLIRKYRGVGYCLSIRMRILIGLYLFLCTATLLPSQTSVTWTSIGPHHINGKTAAPESGKLQALAIFPGDPRIMYAGGGVGSGNEGPPAQAGIFKTT